MAAPGDRVPRLGTDGKLQDKHLPARLAPDVINGKLDKTGGDVSGQLSTATLKITQGGFPTAMLTLDANNVVVPVGRSLGNIWDSEMVINSGSLVSGYNDLPGGYMINNPYSTAGVYLEGLLIRLADPNATVGGSGNLVFDIYLGSATAPETNLILSAQLAAGQNNVIVPLPTSIQCAHNSVLRAKVNLGTTQVNTSVHLQYRGKYA